MRSSVPACVSGQRAAVPLPFRESVFGSASKRHPHRALELARYSGLPGHRAEGRTRHRGVRIAEIWMIHDVVTFKAQLQLRALVDGEDFADAAVPHRLAIAADTRQILRE